MARGKGQLLLIDGVVNLVLGGALLAVPGWMVRVIGAPSFASRFYPSILGGVLVGIAAERRRTRGDARRPR